MIKTGASFLDIACLAWLLGELVVLLGFLAVRFLSIANCRGGGSVCRYDEHNDAPSWDSLLPVVDEVIDEAMITAVKKKLLVAGYATP